jgi:hypothetical protein
MGDVLAHRMSLLSLIADLVGRCGSINQIASEGAAT